ncbi:MAG: LOG family protein [Rickettsiales bacterium]|jgi:predicted Rossmann-fold nucleotide-binding protein|nr:LOG family protein [Rickettsiales bacterium]
MSIMTLTSSNMEKILSVSTADYYTTKANLMRGGLYKGLVAFGSARIPDGFSTKSKGKPRDPLLDEVEDISKSCAKRILDNKKEISFISGGGPSIMDAWLSGANSFNKNPDGTLKETPVIQTSGIALVVPWETEADRLRNSYKHLSGTPETFDARRSLLIEYSIALVIFEGGIGTMDELFVTLDLIKTNKIEERPIVVYNTNHFYDPLIELLENFKKDNRTISANELDNILFFVDTREQLMERLYSIIDNYS